MMIYLKKHMINIYILVLKLLLGLVVFVIQLNNCEWKHWLYAWSIHKYSVTSHFWNFWCDPMWCICPWNNFIDTFLSGFSNHIIGAYRWNQDLFNVKINMQKLGGKWSWGWLLVGGWGVWPQISTNEIIKVTETMKNTFHKTRGDSPNIHDPQIGEW